MTSWKYLGNNEYECGDCGHYRYLCQPDSNLAIECPNCAFQKKAIEGLVIQQSIPERIQSRLLWLLNIIGKWIRGRK